MSNEVRARAARAELAAWKPSQCHYNLRSTAALSLDDLATLVNSSRSSLSRLENNDIPQPFNVAQELEDDELIASSLARQGVTLVQQSKPRQAILYLDNALNIVGTRNLPKLKGYILQALSEANAQDKCAYESWSYLSRAEAITVQPVQERSLIRFNPASTLAQRGVDAVFLEEYSDAIELIDQGLKSYDPTGISGRARLIAMKAEAYYKMGTLARLCTIYLYELMVGRSTH